MKSPYQGRMLTAAHQEIKALEALLTDLKKIAAGEVPTDDDLKDAPLLVGWRESARMAPCLLGTVVEHPLFGTQEITTSQVWSANLPARWARTYSRWYRLGASHKELEADQ
ncbi:DUF6634 family protein [Dongia sp.]|uniref:DUF6634 family protein n=1 Tax=Dongia sp. TaxID=1977262 RepID=UPI0035B4E94E